MEIGLTILLFICMTALLYVVLSLKIARQVDVQMKEFYKTRIHTDMQEFYREMEGYAALFENRIQRFKSLVERSDVPVQPPVEPVKVSVPEPEKPKMVSKSKPVMKSKFAAKKTKIEHKKTAAKKMQTRPAVKAEPVRPVPAMPPQIESIPLENNDTAIAEELMKDLFAQDELTISKTRQKKDLISAAVSENTKNDADAPPRMANFFSRLGKAVEPILFGEKPAAVNSEIKPLAAKETIPIAPQPPLPAKNTGNFSEVLKRAEQIKAEKKAERERAEVEARAEFYAGGDQYGRGTERTDAFAPRSLPAAATRPPERNALAVKELDQHTVNFLIDSLVTDNGYRKQALRALTENNIPLADIARMSKIDIGELELMRQLGRF